MRPRVAIWSSGALVALLLLLVPFTLLPDADTAQDTSPLETAEPVGSDVVTDLEDMPPEPPQGTLMARDLEPFTGDNASTERVLEITEEQADPTEPWGTFDGRPVKVFDIDGDGVKEIIAQNDNHWVYVFDSQDGTLLAELEQTVPSYWKARSFNGPEAAVLERDGAVHIVAANSAAYVSSWRFDATNSTPDAFVFAKEWEQRLDQCHEEPAMDAGVVLADLDLDGTLEILAATEEVGLYVLTAEGETFWTNCLSGGNGEPAVADVTADGWPDVVHVSDAGVVALLDGRTGNWTWGYEVREHYALGSASIPVSAGVADLGGGPELEIVFGARDNHDPEEWQDNRAMLIALDHRGEVLWEFQHVDGNPLTYTTPLLVDADDDGEIEIYWADWNTIGRVASNDTDSEAWDRTGPAHFFRLDPNGTLVWNRTLATWWNNKDLVIADATGDGRMEILANGPDRRGSDGIWYLDVATGEKVAWIDLSPWKAQRAPVVADLRGDNTTQWVIEVAPNAAGTGPAILVYDTHTPYNATWPHPPHPELDAPFDVRFHGVTGNAYWVAVEAQQSGDRIETMEVRVDDGPWHPMENEGWAWTRDMGIPDDATLQFQATGARGEAVRSDCYGWPQATAVDCPVG